MVRCRHGLESRHRAAGLAGRRRPWAPRMARHHIHRLQRIPFEGLAHIASWAREHGHTLGRRGLGICPGAQLIPTVLGGAGACLRPARDRLVSGRGGAAGRRPIRCRPASPGGGVAPTRRQSRPANRHPAHRPQRAFRAAGVRPRAASAGRAVPPSADGPRRHHGPDRYRRHGSCARRQRAVGRCHASAGHALRPGPLPTQYLADTPDRLSA